MINEVYASEETVALAKAKACEMLGAKEEEVEFEVLQFPSKKVLGVFGGKQAQVKAKLKQSPAQKALEFLKEVLFYMGLEELTITICEETSEYCSLKVDGEKVGYIVGKHGETLNSLQYLTSLVINGKNSDAPFCKVRLEANNYREKRRQTLISIGHHFANKALERKKKLSIDPMRSYERKIIHEAISEIDGVKSWSEGEGENRHVVVAPASDSVHRTSNESM